MSLLDAITVGLATLGAAFFVAGSVGLVRFADTPSRLHALTKADNVGLGLVTLGVLVQLPSPLAWLKLALIWLLVLLSSAAVSQLIADHATGAAETWNGDDPAD